jgi:protein-S-isoprenylcysteine O-methyltransferase Ste14
MPDLVLIALAWAVYGAVHSWLASANLKRSMAALRPALMPAYRLIYNGLAVLLLLPPLWLTGRAEGAALWHWPAWIAWPAAALAVGGFLWSLRWYDGMDFIGLRQWRAQAADGGEHERLSLSPLHRHVRHPWYALGLLLLWTRDLNAAWLVTALVVTVYVVVGSRLEERKLEALYGEAYRRYRQRVPGLLPRPGRRLGAAEAAELERLAGRSGH